jgi:P27 family predicted phage terminase small subunit
MLSPPDGLRADGEHLWRTLGKLLLDAGLLTDGDTLALEMLCTAYARMQRANRKVIETGGEVVKSETSGGLYQNPWLHVANRAWEQCKSMLGQFGLTPSERTRVMAAIEEEEDDLAQLLFRRVEDDRNE